MKFVLILACSAAATFSFTQSASFTLDQVLGAPFVSDLTAAPKGQRIAWISNARGRRNIYLAEAPAWHPHRLTNNTADDGIEIGQLQWTPDGSAVVYTRGGDLEMGREVPNPQSLNEPPGQAVWRIDIAGDGPVKVGAGHSPAISSTGSIAFIHGHEIWRDGRKWVDLRGSPAELIWSPGGDTLAFVLNRPEHSMIGVVSNERVRYLSPSVDRDASPVWSPDGSHIAFLRIGANTKAFSFGPVRTAEPWSIWLADVKTAAAQQIFRSKPGTGSAFHPVVAEHQLFWMADDRLVFPWELSGWCQLFAISAQGGGNPTALTAASADVEHVALTPDRKALYYSTNLPDDADRRHILTYPGTQPGIRSDAGIEWSPAPLAEGSGVALLASDARLPAHPVVYADNKITPILTGLENLPQDLPQPRQVVFKAKDGLMIHGQLWIPPPSAGAPKSPAVIFFHGGSRRQMLLGRHYMYYYNNTYAMNQFLASRGYIVLSVNYRSGIGYGMEFREALRYGATGASEYNDVLGAGTYLRSRPEVDSAHIGVWGGSYGGYLTALALARSSDMFAAGVDLHGVHDWNNVIRNFVPAYDPQSQKDAAKLAFDSSPMASVSTWKSPVLLIHGDDDRNVPFGESVKLAEALRKQGVRFGQLVFPDEVHDFLTYEHWLEAMTASVEFLDRNLRPK